MAAMMGFEIKKRDTEGKWHKLPVTAFAGKTIRQIFTECDGQEIVVEFLIDGKRCFFCGTDHWRDRMSQKGQAVGFDYAIHRLGQIGPELLEEIIPGLDMVDAIFPGSTVENVEFQ